MPNKGYKQTKEHRRVNKGKHRSPKTEFLKGYKQSKGKNNPNWRGGRTIDSNGYILIRKPSHPFANHHGYVFEHRLVMEKHLGRYLLQEEVVHHINGIPDDNRIENLELFKNNNIHISFHEQKKKNEMSKM